MYLNFCYICRGKIEGISGSITSGFATSDWQSSVCSSLNPSADSFDKLVVPDIYCDDSETFLPLQHGKCFSEHDVSGPLHMPSIRIHETLDPYNHIDVPVVDSNVFVAWRWFYGSSVWCTWILGMLSGSHLSFS